VGNSDSGTRTTVVASRYGLRRYAFDGGTVFYFRCGISFLTVVRAVDPHQNSGQFRSRKIRHDFHPRGKEACHQESQIWSMDFVADNLFDGRKLRMLTVVDCYTRQSLAIHVGQRLTGEDVVQVLNHVVAQRGKPQTIKTDNPMVESFNVRLRQECLNEHWFMSLADAKSKIEAWRQHYNETRPHSALNWLTPNEFARSSPVNRATSSN
jgi:transposase InsO family protein